HRSGPQIARRKDSPARAERPGSRAHAAGRIRRIVRAISYPGTFMDVLKLLLLLPVLAVCCFSPGFLLVRRWRWTPLETLCASVGASLVFLYLASAATYGAGVEWDVAAWAITGACAAMLAIAWDDARKLAAIGTVRRALYGFAFLLLWTIVVLLAIRVYSGGGWTSDWAEHFQRSLYFLDRFPKSTMILGGYQVPARPPM